MLRFEFGVMCDFLLLFSLLPYLRHVCITKIKKPAWDHNIAYIIFGFISFIIAFTGFENIGNIKKK